MADRLRVNLIAVACALLSAGNVESAEIEFRSECKAATTVVTLGDLAEISSAGEDEKAALGRVDLFPAPGAGRKRALTARQVQDLLVLRGLDVENHRFSGASQITVLGPTATRAIDKRTSAAAARKANTAVKQALADYLASRAGGDVQLKFTLSDEQLSAVGDEIVVAGGSEPWVGAQTFLVSSGTKGFRLAVQVTQSPKVVVATTTLPRGTIIQAADVELQDSKAASGNVKIHTSLEEVIGKETTRNVAPGQILDEQTVHTPIVVRRGEVVDIIARSAGIKVRVKGRSRGDGGLGDLVTVETVTDRKAFLARVSAPQEVEVFAQATSAETAAVTSR